jgi:spermidine synthase
VEDREGRALYVNGKIDAHTSSDLTTRSMTALVPLSLAPRIERVFVIGLGGGLSTAIVGSFGEVERVRVAEISQGVIDALPWFEEVHERIEAHREKVELVRGDAYRLLLTDPERYDVILSEPSSTWVAGVEKLFSEEFYREAARRLRPGGVYAQWITVGYLDDATFVAVLRTFRRVFPWVTVWQTGRSSMLLLGSEAPVPLDVERLVARRVLVGSARARTRIEVLPGNSDGNDVVEVRLHKVSLVLEEDARWLVGRAAIAGCAETTLQ